MYKVPSCFCFFNCIRNVSSFYWSKLNKSRTLDTTIKNVFCCCTDLKKDPKEIWSMDPMNSYLVIANYKTHFCLHITSNWFLLMLHCIVHTTEKQSQLHNSSFTTSSNHLRTMWSSMWHKEKWTFTWSSRTSLTRRRSQNTFQDKTVPPSTQRPRCTSLLLQASGSLFHSSRKLCETLGRRKYFFTSRILNKLETSGHSRPNKIKMQLHKYPNPTE